MSYKTQNAKKKESLTWGRGGNGALREWMMTWQPWQMKATTQASAEAEKSWFEWKSQTSANTDKSDKGHSCTVFHTRWCLTDRLKMTSCDGSEDYCLRFLWLNHLLVLAQHLWIELTSFLIEIYIWSEVFSKWGAQKKMQMMQFIWSNAVSVRLRGDWRWKWLSPSCCSLIII